MGRLPSLLLLEEEAEASRVRVRRMALPAGAVMLK